MTLQVNTGEAKTRLSELVAAAVGEDVKLDEADEPQAMLADLTVVTADEAMREYPVRTLW